ncbi:hypothetical protein GCM10011571_05230 [Marinithermofilum abyssi]|uniref:DUF1450 domain-containing protein n=1 Tax=Marinithermofilum abyssi TaxID=1571185 RepID=A0A8J2YBS4_9BACL|nr:DUF1450 domain-containing protein [Marinithermofilum abyssi]GGE06993.1 hypothetical protein GCM10011571_05230 [Marinithermofilum abyssi]
MAVNVEFCIPNMHNGADAVYHSLKKRRGLRVLALPCIGNCSGCVEKLHVVCGFRRLEADTPDELLVKIIQCASQMRSYRTR